MERLFNSLKKVLYWVSVVAMGVMLLLIFMQVITRYFFGYTFEWSEELARFLFVWVVFLGSALLMRPRRPPGGTPVAEQTRRTHVGHCPAIVHQPVQLRVHPSSSYTGRKNDQGHDISDGPRPRNQHERRVRDHSGQRRANAFVSGKGYHEGFP